MSNAPRAGGVAMFRGLPLVECRSGETVWQAASRAGYVAPQRVGLVAHAHPRDGERMAAWVRAGRHSVPIPIFEPAQYLRAQQEVA